MLYGSRDPNRPWLAVEPIIFDSGYKIDTRLIRADWYCYGMQIQPNRSPLASTGLDKLLLTTDHTILEDHISRNTNIEGPLPASVYFKHQSSVVHVPIKFGDTGHIPCAKIE